MTCVIAAMVVTPSLAFADDPIPPTPTQPPSGTVTESTTATADTVHLRSGGMYRGRVTEIVPGDHVTVRLDSGGSERIAWVDVDRVIVASTAIPPLGPPPPLKATQAELPMSGPRARVHVRAPHPAYLYRRAAGTTDFVTACEAPCDAEMPLGDTYKVGGSGFSTSKEFQLEASPGGSVEVDVSGPNWFGIVGGGLLTIAGAGTAYVGTLVALAAAGCDGECGNAQGAGFAALGVGAGMIALGLLIVVPSMKTDLEQDPKNVKDAFVRPPTWRSASVAENAVPTTFPLLFSRHF